MIDPVLGATRVRVCRNSVNWREVIAAVRRRVFLKTGPWSPAPARTGQSQIDPCHRKDLTAGQLGSTLIATVARTTAGIRAFTPARTSRPFPRNRWSRAHRCQLRP